MTTALSPGHATLARPSAAPRAPVLRRACACGGTPGPTGECEQCRRKRLGLQRSPFAAAPAVAPQAVHDVLRSPGTPLDSAVRAQMEPRFRHSFADVRVHADGRAAESARAVGAHAYAVGPHVVFGAGRYAPGSVDGQRLIAHELAHVVQQRGAASSIQPKLEIGAADDAAEREADAAAERVAGSASTAAVLPRPAAGPRLWRDRDEGHGLDEVYGVTGAEPQVPSPAALRRMTLAELRELAARLSASYGSQSACALLQIAAAARDPRRAPAGGREAGIYDPLDSTWAMEDLWHIDAGRYTEYMRLRGRAPRCGRPRHARRPSSVRTPRPVIEPPAEEARPQPNVLMLDPPPPWCRPLRALVEYENAHGLAATLARYNLLDNNDLLVALNHDVPSIYGDVDVDWMLRLTFTQIPSMVAGLVSPAFAQAMGEVASHVTYFGAKVFWNLLRSTSSAYALEFRSVVQRANLNAPRVVVAWATYEERLAHIFAPALLRCDITERLFRLNRELNQLQGRLSAMQGNAPSPAPASPSAPPAR